jgi:hypothetical protein
MPSNFSSDSLLDQVQAAAWLKLKPKTLEAWRAQRRGPRFIRFSSRCIRYRLRDLTEFASQMTWHGMHNDSSMTRCVATEWRNDE